jgi:hypothetical protein
MGGDPYSFPDRLLKFRYQPNSLSIRRCPDALLRNMPTVKATADIIMEKTAKGIAVPRSTVVWFAASKR